MCGICGVFAYSALPTSVDVIEKMAETIVHRGPDDGGSYLSPDGRVALGHRRLSIIDLSSAGHQPMCNEEGTIWIVFNGEIYNHQELRPELEARGHHYRSRSDTETLIHAYEEWGVDFLSRIGGMFAFAIWDATRGRLLCARDRLGIKPLYYTQQNGRFMFGSEIKAILAHPAVTAEVDENALYHYLTFITTPAPLTMFRDIAKLPPGYYLEIDQSGHTNIQRYWDVLRAGEEFRPVTDEREAADTVRQMMQDSIREQMMSDVPFGVFLSGGVDSSTNVALMSHVLDRPVRTFTVGYQEDEQFNELQYARQIAKLFGTEHHEVLIGEKELEDLVPTLIFHQDEPIADWVCVPLYYVSKLLRDSGTIVVQVGEGSDEIFCGYPGYMQYLRSYEKYYDRWLRLPAWLRRASYGLARGTGATRVLPEFVTEALRLGSLGQELFWGGAVVYRGRRKQNLLRHPERFAAEDSYRYVDEQLAAFDALRPGADILDRMIYLELKIRLAELLLMRVDKITMSVSVEARVPFLDHRLVEYAMRIPRGIKIKDNVTKHVLKQAVRGLLPAEIIDRPKQGFGVPGSRWLRGKLLPFAEDATFHSRLVERDLIDYDYVREMFRAYVAGEYDNSFFLWALINLSKWYDYWLAGKRG